MTRNRAYTYKHQSPSASRPPCLIHCRDELAKASRRDGVRNACFLVGDTDVTITVNPFSTHAGYVRGYSSEGRTLAPPVFSSSNPLDDSEASENETEMKGENLQSPEHKQGGDSPGQGQDQAAVSTTRQLELSRFVFFTEKLRNYLETTLIGKISCSFRH